MTLLIGVMLRAPLAYTSEIPESAAVPVSGAARIVGASENSPRAGYRIDDGALARQFEQADVVAQVLVTTIHRVIDNALSEPGMTAILGYVYSAKTQAIYKGEAGKLLAFRVTLDACQDKLEKGSRYLIFATTDTEGRLLVDSCDSILSGTEAASLLVYFHGEGVSAEREKL
ncbi:hypothetical protein ACNKU7_14830 [Microbulbifer sp. SA54]|uniref:hypothetical protein n=1 Tax=Microbulbifer sp. SA54 TaxID=3401577 RepID=UPI003AAD26F8